MKIEQWWKRYVLFVGGNMTGWRHAKVARKADTLMFQLVYFSQIVLCFNWYLHRTGVGRRRRGCCSCESVWDGHDDTGCWRHSSSHRKCREARCMGGESALLTLICFLRTNWRLYLRFNAGVLTSLAHCMCFVRYVASGYQKNTLMIAKTSVHYSVLCSPMPLLPVHTLISCRFK